MWIRIGFNADPTLDPDPAYYLNADPDPKNQTKAAMPIRIRISHELYCHKK